MADRPVPRRRLAALKALRERKRVTLEELADRTHIPVAHLVALEEGRIDDLPAGPYVDAYVREVAQALGARPPAREESVQAPPPPRAAPLWLVRTGAAAVVLGLVGLFAWQVQRGQVVLPSPLPEAELVGAGPPDQSLVVVVRQEAELQVFADGETVFDGRVAPGRRLAFQARTRLEAVVPGAESVSLEYNGAPVVPQGRQDRPRRLVFLDDLD